jgi:hypothetical protein
MCTGGKPIQKFVPAPPYYASDANRARYFTGVVSPEKGGPPHPENTRSLFCGQEHRFGVDNGKSFPGPPHQSGSRFRRDFAENIYVSCGKSTLLNLYEKALDISAGHRQCDAAFANDFLSFSRRLAGVHPAVARTVREAIYRARKRASYNSGEGKYPRRQGLRRKRRHGYLLGLFASRRGGGLGGVGRAVEGASSGWSEDRPSLEDRSIRTAAGRWKRRGEHGGNAAPLGPMGGAEMSRLTVVGADGEGRDWTFI